MPLHLAARTHAFIHGLFRPSDEAATRALYEKVRRRLAAHGLVEDGGRERFVHDLTTAIMDRFDLPEPHAQAAPIGRLVARVLDYEQLFVLPEIDWRQKHSVTAYWELRDRLHEQLQLIADFAETRALLLDALTEIVGPIYDACPALLASPESDGVPAPTTLTRSIGDAGPVIEAVAGSIASDELAEIGLFRRSLDRLERNLIAASGGNPADPGGFNRAPKLPTKSDIADPAELVATYLGGTPLFDFFDQSVEFRIPLAARFEHHHIIAGSGHGKTQTLQYLIGNDLDAVAAGRRSVVVLDSQGDLIRTISRLAAFAPGGPLHDRIVIIDPTDVEWPVSLNLFDVGIERLAGYAPLERERLQNSILELYDFVLGSLLAAEMTQKQSVIFRYVTRLMLHIPDATIHTLRELMEPGSQVKFAADIAKLSGTARHFFETEFSSKEFEQTKKQVLRRLWGILENQTFERMFSHPRSKLDLFAEMNSGKVILINTAKDLLKEQGTEIFGRFFIALIAQAAQERATLREQDRTPTIVYIDEAADYFDRNIGLILGQARKYKVGMVLAHQYLGQLDPKLQEAFAANTSIKFAGGVSNKDARALASQLACDPRLIEAQPKGSFAAQVRGVTKSAVPLSFPFGVLENQPQMTETEREMLQKRMRDRYAVHYSHVAETTASAAAPEDKPETTAADRSQKSAAPIEKSVSPPRSDTLDTDPGATW